MAKRLAKTVMVRDPDTGQTTKCVKGSIPPRDLARQITNPAAWEAEDAPRERKRKVDPYNGGDYGSGPFRERSDAQVLALAYAHNLHSDTKAEAVAALEAEGVEPDAPAPERPTSGDTNVSG